MCIRLIISSYCYVSFSYQSRINVKSTWSYQLHVWKLKIHFILFSSVQTYYNRWRLLFFMKSQTCRKLNNISNIFYKYRVIKYRKRRNLHYKQIYPLSKTFQITHYYTIYQNGSQCSLHALLFVFARQSYRTRSR